MTPEPEAEIGAVVAALSREQEEALLGAVKCKDAALCSKCTKAMAQAIVCDAFLPACSAGG
jgi:hypothetical protein